MQNLDPYVAYWRFRQTTQQWQNQESAKEARQNLREDKAFLQFSVPFKIEPGNGDGKR
jgi:heme-degrading monooxygenase HmoA